jgi:hypothetical protein
MAAAQTHIFNNLKGVHAHLAALMEGSPKEEKGESPAKERKEIAAEGKNKE